MTERQQVKVKEGSTWTFTVEVRNADESAYSLAGLTAVMQFRLDSPTGTVIADLSSADGEIALDDPTAGDVHIVVPSTATDGLTRGGRPRSVYADLQLRDGSNPAVVLAPVALELIVEATSTTP